MDGICSARIIISLGNRSCCSRLLFIYTEPFLIYTRVDAVINPECSSYPKKAPAPAPQCGFRPLVSRATPFQPITCTPSRLKMSPSCWSAASKVLHRLCPLAQSWTGEEQHPGDSTKPKSATGRRNGASFVVRAALVVPPLVLNKLHYPGCQSGRNIIHSGLSSQAHSNTPLLQYLYLLTFPNKNIESTSFYLFFFNNFFTYPTKA